MGGYENLGPAVSQNPQAVTPGGGSFSAEDRAYESLVFQQNCPPMDWEINLVQSVTGNTGLRNSLQKSLASGFLSGDFNEAYAPGTSYEFLPPLPGNENTFRLKASDVLVNGWNLRIEYSDTDSVGYNRIVLDLPPLSGIRQDLVILEVWRALVSPLPSTDNKSPSGQILRHGNAKAADGPPFTNVNLTDDLIDPSYSAESARRVQIQYRYRVLEGGTDWSGDLISYPDGLGDPALVAHTLPYYTSGSVDGAALATYAYNTFSGDSGLWVAGNGDATSATDIGSVDGYIYAIPLCVVVRRNSAGFDKVLNCNGANYLASVTSDRPDGLFCDQVAQSDLIDLRKINCFNPKEFEIKAVSDLYKNRLSTQLEINSVGCGGTSALMQDSTGPANHLGSSDGVRMNFSNKPITQTVSIPVPVSLGDTSVSVNLATPTDLPWAPGAFDLTNSPAGTEMGYVLSVYFDDGTRSWNFLSNSLLGCYVDNIVYTATGFDLIFNTALPTVAPAPGGGTLYIEICIFYPKNNGTSRNIQELHGVWVPNSLPAWADPTVFTATSDANRLEASATGLVKSSREVILTYPTPLTSLVVRNFAINQLMIPDMVDPSSVVITAPAGRSVTNVTTHAGNTIVTFNPVVLIGGTMTVDYVGYRASPYDALDTTDVFYQSASIQSIPVPAGVHTLNTAKRTEPEALRIITAASGNYLPLNVDASAQIAIPKVPILSYSDSNFFGVHEIETTLDKDDSGLLYQPVLNAGIYDDDSIAPGGIFVIKTNGTTSQDADLRNYWPLSTQVSLKSNPNLPYNVSVNRKISSSFIVELLDDVPTYGRKGTLLLAMIVGYRDYAVNNKLTFDPNSIGLDGVSLYRLRGNPVYYRRTS